MSTTTTARPRPADAAGDTPQALPAAPASERDLLVAVLQEPARMADALAAGIDISSYTDTYCRDLWPVVEQLYRRDGDIAPGALADELRRRNLRTPDMEAWLHEALTGLAMRSVWEPSLERVLEAQRQRAIISAAHRAALAVCAGQPSEDIAAALRRDLAAASPAEPEPVDPPAPREPFPVSALPPTVAAYVRAVAAALPCSPETIALPLLAAVASAIGNSRRVRLKASWSEPSVI